MNPRYCKLINYPTSSINHHLNTPDIIAKKILILENNSAGRTHHREALYERDQKIKYNHLRNALFYFTKTINFTNDMNDPFINEHTDFAFLQKAIIYNELKQYDKSLSILSNVTQFNNEYFFRTKLERGISYFGQATESFDEINLAFNNIYTCLFFNSQQLDDLCNALNEFNELIKHDQLISHARFYRGMIHRLESSYPAAIDDLTFVIKLRNEYYYAALLQRGICYYNSANLAKNRGNYVNLLNLALQDFKDATMGAYDHDDTQLFSSIRLCYTGHISLKLDLHKEGFISYFRALELNSNLINYMAMKKELIFNAIKNIKDDRIATAYLDQCIDRNSQLGRIMWHPRSKNPCSLSSGILRECSIELSKRNIKNSNSLYFHDSSKQVKYSSTKSIHSKISSSTESNSHLFQRSTSLNSFSALKINDQENHTVKITTQNASKTTDKLKETKQTKIQKKSSTLSLFGKKKQFLQTHRTVRI